MTGITGIYSICTCFFRHSEYNYLDAIQEIINHGVRKHNRTGVDTLSIFGMQMKYNLRDGKSVFNLFVVKF